MKLLIVGCGGHGCNCLEIARTIQVGDKPLYEGFAFIDDSHVGENYLGCDVIGTVEDIGSYVDDYEFAFVAIGNNEIRREITGKLTDAGYKIATLISPKANISLYSEIGMGCVVFPFSSVEHNAIVEDGVAIDTGVVVGHDATIEAYSLIYANSVIRPYSVVKESTTITANSLICNR